MRLEGAQTSYSEIRDIALARGKYNSGIRLVCMRLILFAYFRRIVASSMYIIRIPVYK